MWSGENLTGVSIIYIQTDRQIYDMCSFLSVSQIYLHVITYNDSAMRLYTKHGFSRFTLLKGITSLLGLSYMNLNLVPHRCTDYYFINGIFFSAYVFVRYINVSLRPVTPTIFYHISRCAVVIYCVALR